MVFDFNLPVSLMKLSFLINHWRGYSSKHCCVNNSPLSSILNVSQFSEGAAEQSSSPKRAKDTTQQLFWARVQCSSRWVRGMGEGGRDLQSLPSSPRRPSRIYRDWHQTTFPPPSTQTQTQRRSPNMLPQSAGRLDGAISEVPFGDLWPIGNSRGRVRSRGNVECGGKRGFINMLESSLRLFRPPYNSILLNKRLRLKFTNVKMESVCHKA